MKNNYLDFIPVRCVKYTDENTNSVTLEIENRGIFNLMAQKLLKKPKYSYIHLDEIGSFVWCSIDGKNTVYDISCLVKERFGDSAQPLFNRLVLYIKNMKDMGLISLKTLY